MCRPLPIALLALFLSGCGPDPKQVELCWSVLGALEANSRAARLIEQKAATEPNYDVVLVYRVEQTERPLARRTLACGFEGSGFDEGRLALDAVRLEPGEPLSTMELFWLRRWLAIPETRPTLRTDGTSRQPAPEPTEAAFALQLLVNGSVLGCVYGLLALGFTLVHGIIGQINLAFGQIYMIGAMTAAASGILLGALGVGTLPALGAALAVAAATAAAYSYMSERVIFRPLRGSAVHVALIAAIGLAIFLQEYVRLLQGSENLWLDAVPTPRLTILDDAGFAVTVSANQLTIIGATVAIFVVLSLLMRRTGFGRKYRACASDIGMAALLGIRSDRVVATTFVLGGALAGGAGFIVVAHYGVANFFIGFAMGFKGLVAAIVGGIGSVPGAILGGLLLALIETAWSGWLDPGWRDVAVFGLLAVTLIWRPEGLFALHHRRCD